MVTQAEAPRAVLKKRTPTPETDPETLALIQMTKSGSKYEKNRAYENLYNKFALPALSVAIRLTGNYHDAQEVVGDVMLRYWKNPDAFDPSHGKLLSWILRVTHNKSIDSLRHKSLFPQFIELNPDDFESFAVEQGPEKTHEEIDPQLRKDIWTAINDLPIEQREAIILTYFGDLTNKEVASRTKAPLGTVKTRIRIGMSKLKTSLGVINS